MSYGNLVGEICIATQSRLDQKASLTPTRIIIANQCGIGGTNDINILVEIGVKHKTMVAHQLAYTFHIKEMSTIMIAFDTCYQEIFTTNGYTLTRRIVYHKLSNSNLFV